MKYLLPTSLILCAILMLQCSTESDPGGTETSLDEGDTQEWVGDRVCAECHQREFQDWQGSHHDWAMKPANDKTVLGNFEDEEVTLDGVSYRFFKEKDHFKVEIKEINGVVRSYEILYTFGVEPLQQYIIGFPNGKKQVMRVSWDTQQKKWFHQYSGEEISPRDWLHWTNGGQRWNTMCAECHSTGLERNYFALTDSFDTQYQTVNVSCESCHGKGGLHVASAREGNASQHPMFEGKEQIDQIDQCGPCHSRRERMLEDRKTRTDFDDQYILQLLETEFYHADGQIKEEDYVLGSFLQSKMSMNGIKCTDCHNAHSLKLKKEGNALCMSCHEPEYDSPSHHFHEMETESAQCVSCHMTGDTYMGNDFRRDHSFRVPRPDQSVKFGTPNACNGCHSDQSSDWAAKKVNQWYGKDRADHFSDHLLLVQDSRELSEKEVKDLIEFISDQKMPAIARATALRELPLGEDHSEALNFETFMTDPSALIRRQAVLRLMGLPKEQRISMTSNYWSDPSRLVRIAMAEIHMDVSENEIPTHLLDPLLHARGEYERMMISNLDFPTGRLQWGDALIQHGRTKEAVQQYEMALKMDSLLTPTYTSLASALGQTGDLGSALKVLNSLLSIDPQNSYGTFLRALTEYEMGDIPSAKKDLERSIELDPQNYRAYYNLAVLLFQEGATRDAERVIRKGLAIEPNDSRGMELLRIVQRTPN